VILAEVVAGQYLAEVVAGQYLAAVVAARFWLIMIIGTWMGQGGRAPCSGRYRDGDTGIAIQGGRYRDTDRMPGDAARAGA
jgi:hypothetical protein